MPIAEFTRLAAEEPPAEALDEMVDLIRWFRRRYPTVKERFAYATQKSRALRAAPRARIR